MCKYCENLTAQKVYGDMVTSNDKPHDVYSGQDIVIMELLDHYDNIVKASSVAISANSTLVVTWYDMDESYNYFAEQKINYCPMCGRKLN